MFTKILISIFFLILDKPILQECGPYTFIETREKQQIRFENNGERVIYKEFKYYYFDQSRTNGSLDDVVIVPNIPEIAMASQIISKAESIPQLDGFLYGILNAAFHTTDTNIFGKRKVREMLFEGYKVNALEEMQKIINGIPNSPIPFKTPLKDNLFGLFLWVSFARPVPQLSHQTDYVFLIHISEKWYR